MIRIFNFFLGQILPCNISSVYRDMRRNSKKQWGIVMCSTCINTFTHSCIIHTCTLHACINTSTLWTDSTASSTTAYHMKTDILKKIKK